MLLKYTFFLALCILFSGIFANFDPDFFEQSCPYTDFIKFVNHRHFPQSKPVLRKRRSVKEFLKTSSSDELSFFNDLRDRYLDSFYFKDFMDKCHNHYGSLSSVTQSSIYTAIQEALLKLFDFLESRQSFFDKKKLKSNSNSGQAEIEGQFLFFITEQLVNSHCLNKLDVSLKLPELNIKKYLKKESRKFAKKSCSFSKLNFICDLESVYPNYDGSCNNLKEPSMGMSFTCLKRLLPPDYSNGVSEIRNSVQGGPLPNARLISNELLPAIDEIDHELTQMNMQWGQFMVHDTVKTLVFAANLPDCCPINPPTFSECNGVPVAKDDTLFFKFNQTCLRFLRSFNCPRCKLGPRQPFSAVTHTLDLSNLYGPSFETALDLRSFNKGHLAFELDAVGGMRMPAADIVDPLDSRAQCVILPQFPEFKCFQSGDGSRGNQHTALAALENLFLRRHNQHALKLSQVNPHWSDDRLYWEARRLLTAEYNHITFSQYLPTLFSYDILEYFNLIPLKDGYSKYDSDVDPSSFVEWATSAGRFGHSQVNNVFFVKNYEEVFSFNLKQAFFQMSLIHLGQTNGIIRGMISEPAFEVDPYFGIAVKDFLYQTPNRTFGLDLATTNIMRGRDHGIPGYIYYLDYCFGHKVNSWSDLFRYIPKEQVYTFKEIYKDFRDIDFYVGGISERRLKGNAMGPTFACINAMQWYHSKFGDRFFYEHGNEAGSFTLEQLNNIRQTSTSARFICRTTNTRYVQLNAFKFESQKNPKVNCYDLPEINYNLWSEDFYSD